MEFSGNYYFFLFVIFEREILQIYVIAFYRPILTKAGGKRKKASKIKGQKKTKFVKKEFTKRKILSREEERDRVRKTRRYS